ncbi:MAG: Xaa-Pro peptidase family protein [Phascolarctobacterium sp.]|nr:Xaa-Pro peptidase family protein [Phascolarctobacterium sp.]
MDKIHEFRYGQLQKSMVEQDIDCVVIFNSPNLYYMTGYAPKRDERFQVVFVPQKGAPILAVPKMYYVDSCVKCNVSDQRTWIDGDDMVGYVSSITKELGVTNGKIAIDDSLEYRTLHLIMQACPGAKFSLGSNLFTLLRMKKSEDEIAMMIKSGELSDQAVQLVIDEISLGSRKSEAELKTWIEYWYQMQGMTDGFSNLIAFGEGTGSAHHVCNDKVCRPGDAIYLDLGGGYKHYWSDITRSFHMGKPSDEYVSVYNHVREAQARAFAAIKPGVRACDVHMVAWNYLDSVGLSQYFPHRTGHGVGMEGHELPNLSKDNTLILEPGMTFSCEPGVYNGRFGVRIEDTVCVTETGAMSFNHYTKDLIVL